MLKNLTLSLNWRVKIIVFSTMLLTVVSCSPSKKMISNGNYDDAILELVAAIKKKETSEKVEQLAEAYKMANTRDLEKIKNLKLSGQPDIWQEVHFYYQKLDWRRENLEDLPTHILAAIQFDRTNYAAPLEESREKAALYYYTLATKLIESDQDVNADKIYTYLNTVHHIYPGFREVEVLMKTYKKPEPLQVYYAIDNHYPGMLPPGINQWLQQLNLAEFDVPKYRFTSQKPSDEAFKIYAEIRILDVKIAPGQTGELSYTETVEIQDGIAYQLDQAGGFVLDSAGQKIEIPKIETLVCYATEYKQVKSMLILGEVELFDRASKASLGLKKISGEATFEHLYAKFKGDLDALSPESMALIGTKEKDFPTDSQLLRYAGMRLAEDASKKIADVLDNVDLK